MDLRLKDTVFPGLCASDLGAQGPSGSRWLPKALALGAAADSGGQSYTGLLGAARDTQPLKGYSTVGVPGVGGGHQLLLCCSVPLTLSLSHTHTHKSSQFFLLHSIFQYLKSHHRLICLLSALPSPKAENFIYFGPYYLSMSWCSTWYVKGTHKKNICWMNELIQQERKKNQQNWGDQTEQINPRIWWTPPN